MSPPPMLRSIVGYESVGKKGMTQAASSKHFEESKWYFSFVRGIHHGPLAKMHRVSGSSCSGEERHIVIIDVVVCGPRGPSEFVVVPFPRRWRAIVLADDLLLYYLPVVCPHF
jgi:hypothetical protein